MAEGDYDTSSGRQRRLATMRSYDEKLGAISRSVLFQVDFLAIICDKNDKGR